MENEVILPQPRKPWLFLVSAFLTVLLGAGFAMAAIVILQPAPVMEPQVRIIREKGEPEVIIQEVIKEVEVVREVPVLQPPAEIARPAFTWNGMWRPKTSELPMFKLHESKGGISGQYAPSWSRVLSFQGGRIVGNAVEIVVDDSLFRVHFRLERIDEMSLNVTAWITDADWLISLERANKKVATRQEALLVRAQMEANMKMTRKRQDVGVFYRGTGG
jgi:hypothetical protein